MNNRDISLEEFIRLIGQAFHAACIRDPRNVSGWTSVEAFARITGMFVRINAQPGKEGEVLEAAIRAVRTGYATLSTDEFLPKADPAKRN